MAEVDCARPNAYTFVVDVDFSRIVREYGQIALDYVVTHELAHFLQFSGNPHLVSELCGNSSLEHRAYELMADYAGGFVVNEIYAGEQDFNVFSFITYLSDYEFSDVRHHGTVTQRNSAFGMGAFASHFEKELDLSLLEERYGIFEDLLLGNRLTQSASEQMEVFREGIDMLHR